MAQGQQRLVRLGPFVCGGHQRKPENWNICRKKVTAVDAVVVGIVEAVEVVPVTAPDRDRPKRMEHALGTSVERLRRRYRGQREQLGEDAAYTVHLTDPRKKLGQKLWQPLTALPIGPPEALRTSSLMSVN